MPNKPIMMWEDGSGRSEEVAVADGHGLRVAVVVHHRGLGNHKKLQKKKRCHKMPADKWCLEDHHYHPSRYVTPKGEGGLEIHRRITKSITLSKIATNVFRLAFRNYLGSEINLLKWVMISFWKLNHSPTVISWFLKWFKSSIAACCCC